jgi:type VI secretion system protein ImpA
VSSEEFDSAVVSGWLQPLGDGSEPCGKDLEYDNEFLDLNKAAEGKPETQFGPGEPPNWRDVREQAEALMGKTRDLRVALLWLRAVLNLNGFAAFPAGLQLLHGLLSNFWERLHPLPDPDDGDPYARVNALSMLPLPEGLMGDLRHSVLFNLRGVGELRLRNIEVALGQLAPKADEAPMTKEQVSQMLASALEQSPGLRAQLEAAVAALAALTSVMNDKFGSASAPDLRPMVNLIKAAQSVLPAVAADADDTGEAGADGAVASSGGVRLGGKVQSREDALRAIDMICEYLDRTEPTNPAQLLLRRARKLINHNFLQLMKELAPDALNEVARVMGVNPDSVILEE